MRTFLDASWVRLGWAAAGMAVLVPLLALWSTLPGAPVGAASSTAHADGADPADLAALARVLARDWRKAVLCVGDAGFEMARLQAAAQPLARQALDSGLQRCRERDSTLAAIHVVDAADPQRWPAAGTAALAGDDPFPGATSILVAAVQRAFQSGLVVHLPLPDARGERSPGVVQAVPLAVDPPVVVLLHHRLGSDRPASLLTATRPVPHPALLVDAGPQARGVALPQLPALRLVGDGDSWWPEWARGTRGMAWLLTALTVALLGGALATQRALERHDRFRRDIERSVHVGLRAVDRSGRILWANQAFLDMVGWPADQVIGSSEPFIFWAETDRVERQDQWETLLSGQLPGETYTSTFVRPDGSRFPVRVTVHPMKGGNGWMLASTDIANEAETAGRIAGLMNTLGTLNFEAELFRQLRIEAHHHHSTAVGCTSFCTTLAQALEAGQTQLAAEAAAGALRASRASQEEAHRLLHKTRPEQAQAINLWDAVEDGLAMVDPATRDSNVQLINTVSRNLPPVCVPRLSLVFILANLVHNGSRAMGAVSMAQRQLTVLSEEEAGGSRIRLLVRDRGHGVAPHEWEAMFQPRAPANGTGNGVGLYRSREMVRRWGGDLGVADSRTGGIGQGTVMVLTLPLELQPGVDGHD